MNPAMCRLFARHLCAETRFLTIAIPTVETVGFDIPSLPGRVFLPKHRLPISRGRVANALTNLRPPDLGAILRAG